MRILICLLAALALALPVSAADVTGKWTGTVEFKTPDGGTDTGGAVCNITQKGNAITGTAGPEEEQFPIRNGKISGDKITLEVVHAQQEGGDRVYMVALKVVNADRMEGTVQFKTGDGALVNGTLVLNRAK